MLFITRSNLDDDLPRLALKVRLRWTQREAASISGGGLVSGQDADRVTVITHGLDTEYGLDLPAGVSAADMNDPIDRLGDRPARCAGRNLGDQALNETPDTVQMAIGC